MSVSVDSLGWRYNNHMSLGSATKILLNLVTSSRYQVDGNSMAPTLVGGQYLLAKSSRATSLRLGRGDIVVFMHPQHIRRVYIKRIVGLPDESISINHGVTYINDYLFAEPYLIGSKPTRIESDREWWNGPEEYFVLGDNRNDSEDSRTFGPINKSLIVGRVWFRYWPPSNWGQI